VRTGDLLRRLDSRLLPPPATIAATLAELQASGHLPGHVLATVWRVAAGFGLGLALGTSLGALTGFSTRAREVLDPTPPDPVLHDALGSLSVSDQEVLRLWAWEDLAPSEIAVVLGVSANAVSIRLHRAKGHLAEALERTRSTLDTEAHEDPEEVT